MTICFVRPLKKRVIPGQIAGKAIISCWRCRELELERLALPSEYATWVEVVRTIPDTALPNDTFSFTLEAHYLLMFSIGDMRLDLGQVF